MALRVWICLLCLAAAAAHADAFSPRRIHHRATNHFAVANLFKPGGAESDDLARRLAPLLLVQASETNRAAAAGAFGRLTLSNGCFAVDPCRPTIYHSLDTTQLNGQLHPQLTFLWFYSLAGMAATNTALPAQGIRITLNSSGEPVIWEVLADRSSAGIIYAAQSLEAAATSLYGKPLPGRSYSLESSLADAPRTLVARVIDDGPVPMGPVVYLEADTHNVSALLCRCMPAQATRLGDTACFDLAPAGAEPGVQFMGVSLKAAGYALPFWTGDPGDSLERRLRLPARF